jgi:hypothetical protein
MQNMLINFLLFYNRKRKRKLSSSTDGLGSDADTPMSTSTPSATSNNQTFFGADFNPDLVFKSDHEDSASPSAMTSNLRKTLDHRRHLVMMLFQENGLFPTNQSTSSFQGKHSSVFPTKLCLQLKIREVRQKMMAASPSSSQPMTPIDNAGDSPPVATITSI